MTNVIKGWRFTDEFEQGVHDFTQGHTPGDAIAPGVSKEWKEGKKNTRYDISQVLSVLLRFGDGSVINGNELLNEGLAGNAVSNKDSPTIYYDNYRTYLYQPDLTIPYDPSMALEDPREGRIKNKFAFGVRFEVDAATIQKTIAFWDDRFEMRVENSTDLVLDLYEPNNVKTIKAGSNVIKPGREHHAFFAVSGDDIRIRFDGDVMYKETSFYSENWNFQARADTGNHDIQILGPERLYEVYHFGMDEGRIKERKTGKWRSEVIDFGEEDGNPKYYTLDKVDIGFPNTAYLTSSASVEVLFAKDKEIQNWIEEKAGYKWEIQKGREYFPDNNKELKYGRYAVLIVRFIFERKHALPNIGRITATFERVPETLEPS